MKKTDQVKIGVLGVGHLGRWHTQQLQKIENAHLVGVYDSNAERCREIADEFQTTPYPSFESLLKDIEAISIVTPTTTHFDYAKMAIEAGKHVFIEKPITETVEQGNELIRLVKESGIKLQVGHIERFNPAILALEDILVNPVFIESHRLANFNPRGTDVAVVLDLMIHDIDLILRFVKSPVKSIQASGGAIISDTEDIANCRLEFENGCVANVTASRISARKMRKMRFFQPNTYISVDFLEGFSEVYQLIDATDDDSKAGFGFSMGPMGPDGRQKEIRYHRLEKKDINPLNYELSLFIDCILKDTTPAVTVEEAVRDLTVASEILERINEHAQRVKNNWSLT
ncbi:MAG: Gfo/Idh/MocA family oxidoreductase [Calditrichia bacterium]